MLNSIPDAEFHSLWHANTDLHVLSKSNCILSLPLEYSDKQSRMCTVHMDYPSTALYQNDALFRSCDFGLNFLTLTGGDRPGLKVGPKNFKCIFNKLHLRNVGIRTFKDDEPLHRQCYPRSNKNTTQNRNVGIRTLKDDEPPHRQCYPRSNKNTLRNRNVSIRSFKDVNRQDSYVAP